MTASSVTQLQAHACSCMGRVMAGVYMGCVMSGVYGPCYVGCVWAVLWQVYIWAVLCLVCMGSVMSDVYGPCYGRCVWAVLCRVCIIIIIINIIIIKKGRQCKAEREWYTPYQSEDPSPTIPNYRQKKLKGKTSRRL